MTPAEIRKARTSWHYQKLRRAFLEENPLCAVCSGEGRTVAATEIDHVVPALKEPERFWDTDGWQSICTPHHERKTQAENRRETPGQAAWRKRLEKLTA